MTEKKVVIIKLNTLNLANWQTKMFYNQIAIVFTIYTYLTVF